MVSGCGCSGIHRGKLLLTQRWLLLQAHLLSVGAQLTIGPLSMSSTRFRCSLGNKSPRHPPRHHAGPSHVAADCTKTSLLCWATTLAPPTAGHLLAVGFYDPQAKTNSQWAGCADGEVLLAVAAHAEVHVAPMQEAALFRRRKADDALRLLLGGGRGGVVIGLGGRGGRVVQGRGRWGGALVARHPIDDRAVPCVRKAASPKDSTEFLRGKLKRKAAGECACLRGCLQAPVGQ